MLFKAAVFLVAFVAVAYSQTSEDTTTTEKPITTTTVDPFTTTTTTLPPSTTTTPPSTTTSSPSTTTSSPSTTTTSAPTSPSTTPAPPTPLEPVRPFPGNSGHWNVTDKNNVTCILLVAAFQLNVPYKAAINETEDEDRNVTINLPRYANATGDCKSEEQIFSLIWNANVTGEVLLNNLTLTFRKNSSYPKAPIASGYYALQDIEATIYPNDFLFPNATNDDAINKTLKGKNAFTVQLNHSYACASTQQWVGDNGFMVKAANLQAEAFTQQKSERPTFSSPSVCSADDVTDIVPIAVGASLAALVVVVLFAYLIGRRRSRSRGYQSV